MRTTIDIDSDVLAAARELAKVRGQTIGQTISTLARSALTAAPQSASYVNQHGQLSAEQNLAAYIFEAVPSSGSIVTSEMVNQLRDDD